jgi:hypothetical protein
MEPPGAVIRPGNAWPAKPEATQEDSFGVNRLHKPCPPRTPMGAATEALS